MLTQTLVEISVHRPKRPSGQNVKPLSCPLLAAPEILFENLLPKHICVTIEKKCTFVMYEIFGPFKIPFVVLFFSSSVISFSRNSSKTDRYARQSDCTFKVQCL